MPSFSSTEVQAAWRFSLAEDFKTEAGDPYPYTEGGHQQWGDEEHKIPFADAEDESTRVYRQSALSHDGKYLALSTGPEITIYDTTDYSVARVLRGPADPIESMEFRPGDSEYLVSTCANRDNYATRQSLTFFWDLRNYHPDPILDPQNTQRICQAAAKSVITEIETLAAMPITVSVDEEAALIKELTPGVRRLISEKIQGTHKLLRGRLHKSFQASAFSPSGHAMFYLTNRQRKSNGYDEGWQLSVYSPDRQEDLFVLSGHTDSIMWSGFSHDESLIGTCGWDKSIRIWDASDGGQKYKFETEGQNWTGGFSPNDQYFVGTCGGGLVHVYNMKDGTEHMTFDSNKRWCRAIAWHPSSTFFALGGGNGGKLFLIDINKKESFQRRVCAAKFHGWDDNSAVLRVSFLELSRLRIVDGGRKVVFMVGTDGSAEVYDIERECKWRFARAGTENAADNDEVVTSRSGHVMHVWEDKARGQVRIATVDGDGVRFWSVPLTQ